MLQTDKEQLEFELNIDKCVPIMYTIAICVYKTL